MANIFDISQWQQNKLYSVFDIVLYQNTYYYAAIAHNSGTSFTSSNWNGTILDNGEIKPYFFFRPTYNSSIDEEPRIKNVKFGDGYEQTIPDGINNDLLVLNLTFELKSTQEATAILHFLRTRKGSESFVFVAPPPFGKSFRYKCKKWNSTYAFFDNHTIKTQFEQSII